MPRRIRTAFYVDAFNVYYGVVADTPYKWLDYKAAFQRMLRPANHIVAIKYFTAPVDGKYDPDKPNRQSIYIEALKAYIPELSVHFGYYRRDKKWSRIIHSPNQNPAIEALNPPVKWGLVEKTEEKGSDVNLSVHLLNDAYQNLYDCAVVVSNDSDLEEAIRLVKQHHQNKIIGIMAPGVNRPTFRLRQYSDFNLRFSKNLASISQLPDSIPGTNIHKPEAWN